MMKKLCSIKSILFYFLLLGMVKFAYADHMKITLKNNTFDITSLCRPPEQQFGRGDYKCNREYVIELISKYNVFDNYTYANGFGDRRGHRAVVLQTSLYEIHPQTYAKNKSKLNIYLTDKDLEKISESGEVQVNFSLNLFSEKLLRKEIEKKIEAACGEDEFCVRSSYYKYETIVLEPSVTLILSNTSIDRIKSDCTTEYKQCLTDSDNLNSPANRLKRYFSD